MLAAIKLIKADTIVKPGGSVRLAETAARKGAHYLYSFM